MKSILKISEAASLALHTMYYITSSDDTKLINTKDISDSLHVSEAHLRKVVQRLVKAGFLETFRGPRGGIKLAKKPEDINLMSIYEAIEAPMVLSNCLLNQQFCSDGQCMLSDLVVNINEKVVDYFKNTTLANLNKTCITV